MPYYFEITPNKLLCNKLWIHKINYVHKRNLRVTLLTNNYILLKVEHFIKRCMYIYQRVLSTYDSDIRSGVTRFRVDGRLHAPSTKRE